MEQIVLAGASFVFGLDEIREAFLSIGIESSFAEVPYMLKYQKISEKELFGLQKWNHAVNYLLAFAQKSGKGQNGKSY